MNAVTDKFKNQNKVWKLQDLPSLSDEEFYSWQTLMQQRTGISLSIDRKTFLITTLSIRIKELQIPTISEYYKMIIKDTNGVVEWETLVDRLTIHETRFFRDKGALELIGKQYLTSNEGIVGNQKTLQIWSVGCASGEEPYSIAIALDLFMKKNNINGYLGIIATDISRFALAKGRTGVYHRNRLKDLPNEYLQKYFRPVDLDHYIISDSIRDRVCFSKLNLINIDSAHINNMDIIYCQNVLIYFQREIRIKILNQLVDRLKPGGILVLGPGEITSWDNSLVTQFSQGHVLAYQRLEEVLT